VTKLGRHANRGGRLRVRRRHEGKQGEVGRMRQGKGAGKQGEAG
jgi:hypothetical protein